MRVISNKRLLCTLSTFIIFIVFITATQAIGLSGKVIVIDPGHAPDKGAVGINGLTEMELNLKVAQYLKQSLTEAGAVVFLTREDDKGAYAGITVAKHELAARVKLATEEKCDLFISIHHNANAQEDRSVNQTEVYYNVFDFGPSRDVATLVYDNLVQQLGTPRGYPTPMPAEYYVLRKANGYPAVLGEAAYIINPQAESALSREEFQKKEAKGYFNGIQQYFARGISKIVDISPSDGSVINNISKFQINANVTIEKNGPEIDPETLSVTLDNVSVPAKLNGNRIAANPEKPLTSGKHTIAIELRNKKGNSAMEVKSTFIVELPPKKMELKITPTVIPPDEATEATLSAWVKDENDNLVGDDVLVTFFADNHFIGSVVTQKGIASLAFRGKPYVTTTLISVVAGNISATSTLDTRVTDLGIITGQVTNPIGKPIVHAAVRIGQGPAEYTNTEGRFYITDLSKGKYTLMVTSPGYLPGVLVAEVKPGQAINSSIEMTSYLDGVLMDKTYIVDPAYGGTQSGAVGPTGLSAAEVNLRVANYLRDYLVQAGSKVIMTRTGIEPMADIDKVILDSSSTNNHYLIINHGKSFDLSANYSGIYHFPGQRIELSKAILNEFKKNFDYPFIPYKGKYGGEGMIDNSDYLIVQSYGIRIEPSLISNPDIESKLRNDSYLMEEAYTIYNGILINAGLDTSKRGEIGGLVTDSSNAKPVGNILVTLDDGTKVMTDQDTGDSHGKYRIRFATAGPHRVTVSSPGYETQTQGILITADETAFLDFSIKPKK